MDKGFLFVGESWKRIAGQKSAIAKYGFC